MQTSSIEVAFRGSAEEYVAIRCEVSASGCWVWSRYLDRHGYGKGYFRGRTWLAHRLSYAAHFGSIPDGLTIDHLCKNTRCVNPKHLEPVSNRENVLRGTGPSALCAKKTHCHRGHLFDHKNTNKWMGKRVCRACKRDTSARRRSDLLAEIERSRA